MLLQRLEQGDLQASQELYDLVYADLRRRADRIVGNRAGTIQATALVHEAWLKLRGPEAQGLKSRGHFLGVAAKAMRSVLVDHARAKAASKRSGGENVELVEMLTAYEERALDVVGLNDALDQLNELDPRLARIVELRFFAGLTIEETAEAMDIGRATVERGWNVARVWLRSKLGDADGPESDEH